MKVEEIQKFIKEIELFKDLSDEEITLIANQAEVCKIKKGEKLFEENAPRTHLYMIADGEIELVKSTTFGSEKILTVFGKYDFLGEGALMDDYPHPTSARAALDSTIILLHCETLYTLMQSQAQAVV